MNKKLKEIKYDMDEFQEFLQFCYGPHPSAESRQGSTSSPSRGPQGLNSPSRGPQGLNSPCRPPLGSPSVPLSPVKKFSGLERVCLDALVQLFGPRPLPQGLSRSTLSVSRQLTEVAVTPQQVSRHLWQLPRQLWQLLRQLWQLLSRQLWQQVSRQLWQQVRRQLCQAG